MDEKIELSTLHNQAAGKVWKFDLHPRRTQKAREIAFFQTAFTRIYWLDTELMKLRSDVDTPALTADERQVKIYAEWILAFEAELALLKTATGFQDFFISEDD